VGALLLRTRSSQGASAVNGSNERPRARLGWRDLASRRERVRERIDTVATARWALRGRLSTRAGLPARSCRMPKPRCGPVAGTIRGETRGLVWNLARARPSPMAVQARGAAFVHPRQDQSGRDRHHPPEGGERRQQSQPEVRHTRDPRDHLDSFGNVVGAGPSRPPRLASPNHIEERAFESLSIRLISVLRNTRSILAKREHFGRGTPLELIPTKLMTQGDHPMYQKTCGGQSPGVPALRVKKG